MNTNGKISLGRKILNFLKTAFKWTAILAGFWTVSTILYGLPFDERTNYFLIALGFAIAYVDGTLKDRIRFLEARVEEHSRKLYGIYDGPYFE